MANRCAVVILIGCVVVAIGVPGRADPPTEHPLEPSLRIARRGHDHMTREIQDYTCVLVKRERVDGKLTGPEAIFAKVRHERTASDQTRIPFSVYMKFLKPRRVRGREILFSQESTESKLLVRNGGNRLAFLTVSLSPHGRFAMNGNRYPITEFGIKRLAERMIELGTAELAYPECQVVIDPEVKVGSYHCTCIEVKHPVKRDWFTYHIAKVFIDDDLGVPVRFESYDWPETDQDSPILQEEYTYLDLKLNVGLTSEDFQPDHPDYDFR